MPVKSVSMSAPTDYGAEQERIARARKYAEMLQQESIQGAPAGQMAGNTFVPTSPLTHLAKALQGVNARKGNEFADADAKALGAQRRADTGADMQTLISALQGTKAQPSSLQEDAGGNTWMSDAMAARSPTESLQTALPNMRTPEGQQMGFGMVQQQIAQQMKPPERVDGGDKWLLVKDNVIVGTLPKGATPDAALREAGSDRRHLTPSGSAVLSEQGQNQRHLTPSGSTLASNQVAIRGQNLTDSRARDTLEQGRWTNDLERGVQVNSATGETRPITSGGAPIGQREKPLTESQAKASVFHSQMAGASQALAQIPGYDPNSGLTQADTAVAGGRGNMIASETAQRAKQAQSQWAESFLRFKTGAASTPAEVALNVATFFPQIGDKPGVVEQKAQMRAQAERDLAIAAGRGDQGQSIIKNDSPGAPKTVSWASL